jgi:hypothetical protein
MSARPAATLRRRAPGVVDLRDLHSRYAWHPLAVGARHAEEPPAERPPIVEHAPGTPLRFLVEEYRETWPRPSPPSSYRRPTASSCTHQRRPRPLERAPERRGAPLGPRELGRAVAPDRSLLRWERQGTWRHATVLDGDDYLREDLQTGERRRIARVDPRLGEIIAAVPVPWTRNVVVLFEAGAAKSLLLL